MEELMKIVQQMDTMEVIYWGIALTASLVFCIQAVMLIVGFDADADFSGGDADFDADGVSLVSVKTLVCFLLGFGWTGALFWRDSTDHLKLALCAFVVGLVFMLLIAVLLKQVLRLSKDGTFNIDRIVGATAEVYLRIPGGDESGKITVSHQGSTHELLAFADEEIATGSRVVVEHVIDDSSVFVVRQS